MVFALQELHELRRIEVAEGFYSFPFLYSCARSSKNHRHIEFRSVLRWRFRQGEEMISVEDAEDLNIKLVSERAKVREEGVKALGSYLDGAAGVSLCPLLDHQTALLHPNDRITSATWPGMLHALCQCIEMEVAANKKRGPKPFLAKTLRNFVQKAEDVSRSGKTHPLLRKIKKLFQHLLDMIQDVPAFSSDYGHILRQLLPDVEYRLRMGKKIYNDLVAIYLAKAKDIVHGRSIEAPVAKEEAFRNMLTLLTLMQYPPGELAAYIKDDIIDGFCDVFSFHRDEDRITKKLLSSLNAFLLINGLNIGDEVVKLHTSIRPFLVRTWLTTRDRDLKDELILYTRMQLKLQFVVTLDEGGALEELMGLVEKELDQTRISLTGRHRPDNLREEKVGSVSRSEQNFLELAAAVLFEVGRRDEGGVQHTHENKRRRKENVYCLIKHKIASGKTLWDGAFCFLIRDFGLQLSAGVLSDWLEGLAGNLERVMGEAVNTRAFDNPVWFLRCLQELSTLWPTTLISSTDVMNKKSKVWQSIWESMLHWLPLYINVTVMVDETYRLLGLLVTMQLVPACIVSPDFWELQSFSEVPSGNLLYFVAAFFGSSETKAVAKGDLDIRSKLLEWSLRALDAQDAAKARSTSSESVSTNLLNCALMALSMGFIPLPHSNQASLQPVTYNLLNLNKELVHWSEVQAQQFKEQEVELKSLDRSFNLGVCPDLKGAHPSPRSNPLPRSSSDILLQHLSEMLLQKVNVALQNNLSPSLPQLFSLCAVLSSSIFGVECLIQRRGQGLPDWCTKGRVWLGLANILELCLSLLEKCQNQMQPIEPLSSGGLSASLKLFLENFTPAMISSLSIFLSSPGRAVLVASGGVANELSAPTINVPIMTKFLDLLSSSLTIASDVAISVREELGSPVTSTQERDGGLKLMDVDLDEFLDSNENGEGKSALGLWSKKRGHTGGYDQWKGVVIKMVANIGLVLPKRTCIVLLKFLDKESDTKVRWNVLLNLCTLMKGTTLVHLPEVVHCLEESREECQSSESARCNLLTAIDAILTNLLAEDENYCGSSARFHTPQDNLPPVPEKTLSELSSLVADIATVGLLLWPTRAKFVHTVSNFILASPNVAQGLIEKLLILIKDPEYRVRRLLSRRIKVFFKTWNGHLGLLQDVCDNFGVKMVMVTKSKVVPASEVVFADTQGATYTETAVFTLGEIAIISDKVEGEALFMLCAHAALNPPQRPLVSAVLDKVARHLKYPDRWKYMEYLMGGLLTSWVTARMSISLLVEIKELIRGPVPSAEFLEQCCPWLLPALFMHDDNDELKWIAEAGGVPLSALVRQHFASVFASLLPLHSHGTQAEQQKAAAVLQGNMLSAAQLTEDERDNLIRRLMISIVNFLFRLSSALEMPQPPYYTKAAVTSAVRTVVDGFLEIDQPSQEEGVVDNLQVFRPDRVFMLLLQFHYEIDSALCPRHRRHLLAGLLAILTVIDKRVIIPSTCRYAIHIILQSIEVHELQEQCCTLLGHVLDKLEPLSPSASILGDQLQSIVSKLVSCITAREEIQHNVDGASSDGTVSSKRLHSSLVGLLQRITVEASRTLHDSIKELNPFPELPIFKPMRELHMHLCAGRSLADEFVQFVNRAPGMLPQLQSSSLQSLANKLRNRRGELYTNASGSTDKSIWPCSTEVVAATWKLVQLCDEQDATDMRDLAGRFLAAIGMGDPYAVVFHLPGDFHNHPPQFPGTEIGRGPTITTTEELGVTDKLVKHIMLQIRGYLVDSNVQIIEMASRTLKGLLATERGHCVLRSMTSTESAYLEVHSKGVNVNLVENMLSTAKKESASIAVSMDQAHLWQPTGASYDVWVRGLAHSLIEYTNDDILRLCQGLVFHKASLAELVFPHILGVLAAQSESNNELCKKISTQVEANIFSERNQNMRSIQLFLGALNYLRCNYVSVTMKKPATGSRGRDQSKGDKSSGNSGEGRTGSAQKSRRSVGGISEQGVSDVVKQLTEIVSSWQKVYWLQIDYLTTARAAQRCAAYFTTVLYVEYWCKEQFGSLTLGEPDFSTNDTLPAHLELLLMVYTKINEPDGVYGVARSHKVRSQLLTYEHEGNWSKAVESYDLLLRSKSSFQNSKPETTAPASVYSSLQQDQQYQKGLMNSLRQMGCTHVVDLCYQGLSHQGNLVKDPEFKELQYEAAWRACRWDTNLLSPDIMDEIPNAQIQGDKSIGFNAQLHRIQLVWVHCLGMVQRSSEILWCLSCLRSLVEGEAEFFYPCLQQARQGIITSLTNSSMESTQTVNPAIMKLQMLEGLSQSWEMRWRVSAPSETDLTQVVCKVVSGPVVPSDSQVAAFQETWQESITRMHSHYELLEPYVTFRKVLFQVLNRLDYLPQHLLEFSIIARKAGRPNHAENLIHELKLLSKSNSGAFIAANGKNVHKSQTNLVQILSAARVEEAKILWAQGQQEMAVNLMKYILQHTNLEAADSAAIHCLTGKWLAETRSESFRVILDRYLSKSVELMESTVKTLERSGSNTERWVPRLCRMYYRLAHYTDALYKSYEDRLTSNEWQAALRLRQHKAEELEVLMKRLNSQKGNTRDYSMKIFELQKQLALDVEEAQRMQDDKDQFLGIALENYRSCLLTGNKYDLRVVFRLLSLWFNMSIDSKVVDKMLDTVQKVQSFKFVPLVYQIASRMGSCKESTGPHSFQTALTCLVRRMAIEHPYHTMYQLLALSYGDRVKENQRGKMAFVVDMDKKHAAEALLNSLASHHKELILQMRRMVELYIKLAELETTKEQTNKTLKLPRDVRSVKELEWVPVITAHIPVDPGCQYLKGSFPYFKGLSDTVVVMNGINAPKVIECKGSDGRIYKQLAKSGNDDLRQDAVMEQLFGLVNTLLQAHPDTCRRQLCVRTYKVIPFTPSAGVLEWVDGTIPLGEYLLGSTRSGGAHARYGLGDWTFMACREHMSTEKDKRRAYETVCKNFRPVMHNFFLERFAQASDWFEKRLAYTRSVATSSMVGYVVGLGDRHSMNVLMDQVTAEVVHIDLGVAFEQGLMLKTPERVPFRLTRDIVDGMGVSGVEGIYRRCCEATLSVMRTNKEALLTIIEVFIYDPLYKWALSPLKALQRQQEMDPDADDSEGLRQPEMQVEGNKDAARALLRVKQKLDGYEEGEMRSLQGQVQQLIQDAQDPERLSHMFPGWGAWL